MIKTGSRGGVIALFVLALCIPIFAEKKQRTMQIVMLAAGLGAMMLAPHSELAARMQSLFSGQDYNLSGGGGRWDVWSTGIRLMFTHPLVGVGIGAFPVADAAVSGQYVDAHNAYVQIAAELGILGIGSLVVMIMTAFKSIQRSRKMLRAMAKAGDASNEVSLDAALATAALCSMIAELSAAMFLSMAYDAMTMFALTVPMALAMTQRSPGQLRAAVSQGAARVRRQFAARPAAVPRGLVLPPGT
jgi:O-antigen ligase